MGLKQVLVCIGDTRVQQQACLLPSSAQEGGPEGPQGANVLLGLQASGAVGNPPQPQHQTETERCPLSSASAMTFPCWSIGVGAGVHAAEGVPVWVLVPSRWAGRLPASLAS